MKKMTLAVGVGALAIAIAGGAIAQQALRPARAMPDPFGTATITRAEAQAKAAEIFTRLDANKDGKLDQADRAARRAARDAAAFDRLDTNKDGKIDKAEFAAAHPAAPAAGATPAAMDRKGWVGRGHDGKGRDGRGRDGFAGGMGGGWGGRMAGGMDANGDKVVTRDEFIAGALKRFDAADANKDGKLTPEERRAAVRKLRAMMPPPPPPAPGKAPAAAPAPATSAPAPK
jgi:hypothetical protein